MDLKTFVRETLVQIVAGVAEAKAEVAAMGVGAAVNPETTYSGSGPDHASPTDVSFDVAVTVVSASKDREEHEATGSAGGVLAVVGLKIGGKVEGAAEREDRQEAVSRIKFAVKLGQPGDVNRKAHSPIPRSSSRY